VSELLINKNSDVKIKLFALPAIWWIHPNEHGFWYPLRPSKTSLVVLPSQTLIILLSIMGT